MGRNSSERSKAALGRPQRDSIVTNVIATVEKKQFYPGFDGERWRDAVESERPAILAADSTPMFEAVLDELVRSAGTPDSGFFHKNSRKAVPKGIAARFQYCQPGECAPAHTRPSEGGDVFFSRMGEDIGWLKVTKFPGAVGIDMAKQIDRAVQELNCCRRLVLDLRGNAGGGLAFLRLMSYLTPDRLPVGYSVTRKRADAGYSKDDLTVFGRIPSRKAALLPLALKFTFRDDSIRLVTEGLGAKPFHGRVVILVDETTTGAGERIAAFAQERQLAPVMGTRTAGRLICCSVYRISHGYHVRIPARAWYTWRDELLEGKGVSPDHAAQNVRSETRDIQLESAADVVRQL